MLENAQKPVMVAVLTFGLNVSAHVAELLRSALGAADQGQAEAARTLGFSAWDTFRLIMLPQVLLFDEPTSALDPTMVGEVLAVIRMLAKRDMSMLIVTHEMNFAREVASRVLFLADGGIYEQGTPDEIFDVPKREKTLAFIHKIKYFAFDITDRQFDLMQLQGGIQNFGEKYGLDRMRTARLQICCEELIYELLAHCFPGGDQVDLNLSVSHAESDGATQIAISCGGAAYDPFSQADDGLGVTILKNMASRLDYALQDGRNVLNISL